jgi:hypothetical protein
MKEESKRTYVLGQRDEGHIRISRGSNITAQNNK